MVTARRYTTVAILLHWLIAGLVIANIALGWRMESAEGMTKFAMFQLHKSLGISVLLLTVLRIAWRFTHRPPPLPDTLAGWERALARITHTAFYVLLLALPLTGWAIVSASRYNLPTMLFGAVPWPHLGFIQALPLQTRDALGESLGGAHGAMGLVMAALVALHVGAAIKHQLAEGPEVLTRMLPRFGRER